MHMARLWDAARSPKWGGRGYGLEALSEELVEGPKKTAMKDRDEIILGGGGLP